MKLKPGQIINGFEIVDCIHSGAMALIYKVLYAPDTQGNRHDPGFEIIMKLPRMSKQDGSENIVSFEVEHQILPHLTGPNVPRFVAAGDLSTTPYLVMEYVKGKTVDHWLENYEYPTDEIIAKIGASIALAVHQLHKQNVCHLDLKPSNIIIKDDFTAVLIDFGLSYHAHFPDLLAEQMRKATGSPAYIAPEQVVGVRGDPRSDIFSLGVILYELATKELPFGAPIHTSGMRQRLWMDPKPMRKHRIEISEWLQEVVLKCLEAEAKNRYPSAAHLALDLTYTDQIVVTDRGRKIQGTGFRTHFKRWIKAAGAEYKPSLIPNRQIEEVPIVMVAVPLKGSNDATLYSLREAVSRSLGIRPGAHLACVTIISPDDTDNTKEDKSETNAQRFFLTQLKLWAQPLNLTGHQVSYHVLESSDVARAIVFYAETNNVSMIIMGHATNGLKLQRLITTVPIKVAMRAPCTIILVKQSLPFEKLN
jgi:serine/threonine protein kinase